MSTSPLQLSYSDCGNVHVLSLTTDLEKQLSGIKISIFGRFVNAQLVFQLSLISKSKAFSGANCPLLFCISNTWFIVYYIKRTCLLCLAFKVNELR